MGYLLITTVWCACVWVDVAKLDDLKNFFFFERKGCNSLRREKTYRE
jgi:hypothetical protein